MSDDQRNPDNTDASSPSDQDQGPEEQQGEMEQAAIERSMCRSPKLHWWTM
jgi:hypothetical protein